jgi:AcrR family transcriptional regulator
MQNAIHPTQATKTRGRPREFDLDVALDKAVHVFCERGYHATSINDLTEAMGLASGSVYKAFKDKRALFIAAFDRDRVVRTQEFRQVLDTTKSGREKLRDALALYTESSHGVEGRRGCLVVGSAVELAIFDDEIAERVKAAVRKTEANMAELVCLGQADGSISPTIDGAVTARLMLGLIQGMRMVGKTGRNQQDMKEVADMAMKLLD